jgi:hypothetical protein
MLRKPDSIPTTDTIIEDPLMEPYFIVKSTTGGYAVYERVVKGEKKTEYIDTKGYPSTFNSALKMVSKHLLNHPGKDKYNSIKEYIQTFEKLEEQMKTLIAIE